MTSLLDFFTDGNELEQTEQKSQTSNVTSEHKHTKVCIGCNQTFGTNSTGPIKYCPPCKKAKSKNKEVPTLECVSCKNTYQPKSSRGRGKYCPDCKPRKDITEGTEGIDFITCPECNKRVKEFNLLHAKMHGCETISEFKEKHNLKYVKCQKIRDNWKGENNPGYQHGGTLSPFSEKFVKGYDADWHEEQNKKHSERMSDSETNMFSINYWIKEADGDEELARKLYGESQTRDLDFFTEKYGVEEGTIRHKQKTEKWLTSFKKQNFSHISQTLFNDIMKHYVSEFVYYATYHREDMSDYVNKEYFLETTDSYIRPDFIDLNTKKIIEFDGDYWHSNARANPTREAHRDSEIIKCGYTVLHIREQDYNQDREKVVQECINFLTT